MARVPVDTPDPAATAPTEPPDPFESLTPAERDQLLAAVPAGAIALAGATVILLLIGWFALYLFIFLPRGGVS